MLHDELNEKLGEIETNILRIDNELIRMNKNVDKMAKRTELKELENMIEIFSPMRTNFTTKEDVRRIIKEMR
jgi:hypothetical protein